MLTLKTGKGPAHRRNLRNLNYHTAYDMDWLQEYDNRNMEASDFPDAADNEKTSYSKLACSSNSNGIDDVCDSNSMNLCSNNSESTITRIG